MASCIGFQMIEVEDALEHIAYEVVRDYGDRAYGNELHTWDDGKRLLGRCKKCGGYLLIQHSEFHSFVGEDSYYTDYFPVESEEDVEELNRKYDGFDIERKFPGRYMIHDGNRNHWTRGE